MHNIDLTPATRPRFGVRELWIADPETKRIEVLTNSGDGFRPEAVFGLGTVFRSTFLPGLEIPIAEVF
jgi:Uma2 family endonuclease